MRETTQVAPKTTAVRKEGVLTDEMAQLLAECVKLWVECQHIKQNELKCWHAHRCQLSGTCPRAKPNTQQPMKVETVQVEAPIAALAA